MMMYDSTKANCERAQMSITKSNQFHT